MSEHVKIVLPCANEEEWVRATVDSLLASTDYPSFEILISANGDTQTDFSFIDRPPYAQRVRLKRTEGFLGVGNSLNVAVEPGDAAYYFFLDAHCLVERPDWLSSLVRCMEEHPDASTIQPEVLVFTYDGTIPPGAPLDPQRLLRRFFDYGICWAWPYDDPWHIADDLRSKISEEPFPWMAASGMAMFCRADTFHRLGGFDREVDGWFREGLDYCIRGWLLGHPTIIEPRVRILHLMKLKSLAYPRLAVDMMHGFFRTTYKYFSPRRQALAQRIFRLHGLDRETDRALERLRRGNYLAERAQCLRDRVHDDDWLFAEFYVHESCYTGEESRPLRLYIPESVVRRPPSGLRVSYPQS